MAQKVLVIDIGGSHVKFLATGRKEPSRFRSGKRLTPDDMIAQLREHTRGWKYDVASIGYPGPVDANGPAAEPENLGTGWAGFDFAAALGKPVKVLNDAAMQALGSYDGGRMLFLGLGTGLGSTLIAGKTILPLRLGELPLRGETMNAYLNKEGLARHGEEAWQRGVHEAVDLLRRALAVDYVVLGGGNVEKVKPLPEGARRGGNENAFEGGFRLWQTEVAPLDPVPKEQLVWKVG